MEQPTQNFPAKSSKKRKYIGLGILVLVLIVLFGRNTLLGAWFSTIQHVTLPHYKAAEVISQSEFEKIGSDSRIVRARELESMPDLNAYLENSVGEDQFHKVLIIDAPAKNYYILDTLSADLDVFTLWSFPFSLAGEPEYMVSSMKASDGFPLLPKEWKATGGLACFSCGCSCYMEKELKIANGERYVNVSGEDYAIRSDRQGIYHYDVRREKWVKLTPKLNGDFKVTDNGCAVAYSVQSSFYKLRTCSS